MSQDQIVDEKSQGDILKDKKRFQLETIVKYSLILIAIVVFFWAVYHARVFLIPLTFGVFFAMLLDPISSRLEKWGWNRLWSSFVSVIMLVVFSGTLVFFLSTKSGDFASYFSTIHQKITKKYQSMRQAIEEQWKVSLPSVGDFLSDKSPSSSPAQEATEKNQKPTSTKAEGKSDIAASRERMEPNTPKLAMDAQVGSTQSTESDISASSLSSIGSSIMRWFSSLMSTFGDIVLALVYTFLLLCYREKFRQFLLRVTPGEEHSTVNRIIDDTSGVARKYLWGRFILIVVLAILYGVGFMAIGLKQALFLALTAAVFTFLPYIGPFIGIAFPVLVALASDNVVTPLIGVLVIYVVAQFVESYILGPMIVGAEVDINPFFTIVAVVVGGLMWGVSGMILGIPILGIARIILDNIEPLRPYAFLLGEERKRWRIV